jgi:hypothetical protein
MRIGQPELKLVHNAERPAVYTIATVADAKARLPAANRNYVLKRDGVPFAIVDYEHTRSKHLGGPAWRCRFTIANPESCAARVIYHKDRNKLLADAKNLREGRPLEFCK